MVRKGAFLGMVLLGLLFVLEASRAQDTVIGAPDRALLPVAALAMAALAAAIAAVAFRDARRTRADFLRFSRSIEIALHELSLRSKRDAAAAGELNRRIAIEIEALTGIAAQASAAATAPARPGAARATGSDAPPPAAAPSPDNRGPMPEAVRQALAAAIAAGDMEVSLQPIVSIAEGAATGFEVHAHVEAAGEGHTLDIRRMTEDRPGLDRAAFEAALVRSALAAGDRQLGADSRRTPFHVAISQALLGSREAEAIADMARAKPALSTSLVLSIPAGLLAADGETRDRLERLTAAGFGLAVEGWDGAHDELGRARSRGVRFLKMAAGRLAEGPGSRDGRLAGSDLAGAAAGAGLALIATGVDRDDDAVGLIDLGIDLMEGSRFSGPRRLRADAGLAAPAAQM